MGRWTMAVAITLGAVLACAPTPAPNTFTDVDASTLRTMFTSTPPHFRSRDWKAWTALWSEDGFFQVPNGATVVGRPQLEAWANAMPPVEEITFDSIQINGDGNMAYGTSTYVLKLQALPADTGKQLVIFRRQTSEAPWQVVAASFNSSIPLPLPAAIAAPKR